MVSKVGMSQGAGGWIDANLPPGESGEGGQPCDKLAAGGPWLVVGSSYLLLLLIMTVVSECPFRARLCPSSLRPHSTRR